MKKLIASRKLKRTCACCNRHFAKDEMYYKIREVYPIEGESGCVAAEYLLCPKCKWKLKRHYERLEMFKKTCSHPEKFIETEWSYIPGECVKEPDYNYCKLCGEII